MTTRKNPKWIKFQPNDNDPKCKNGDCVIRAICKATDKSWMETFDNMLPFCRYHKGLHSSKIVYDAYLIFLGYHWVGLKAEAGKSRPTPNTFNRIVKQGTYVLSLANHMVTWIDGKFYDTWDCGDKCIYGYWTKEI